MKLTLTLLHIVALVHCIDVVVDTNTQLGTSNYSPGMSQIDSNLNYPWSGNNQAAVDRAKTLWSDLVVYSNTHIMAWGAPDLWPDSSTADPTDWSQLDYRMQLNLAHNKTSVITLCEAPWWMKGQLQADNSTTVLTEADEWTDLGYGSRILDNMFDKWLHLVQRVAERYMVAPYNVRIFQVWNELKGYYNPIVNHWDYDNSPGDASGPNAKHGYTFLYNKTYKKLIDVAKSLNISEKIIVGGPYPVMDSWGGSQSNPSQYVYPWGTFDQRPIDAISFWLKNKVDAGFVTFDGDNSNRDGVLLQDAFVNAEKFRDMVLVVRDQVNGTSIPVWFAEWYCYPRDGEPYDPAKNAAIKTYAVMLLLDQNVQTTLSWGGSELGLVPYEYGTWNETTSSDGGYPTTWYYAYKAFGDYFGPGTPLFGVSISDNTSVHAVSSDKKVFLVNKSNTTVSVNVTCNSASTQTSLGPYQVYVMDVPMATTTGTAGSTTAPAVTTGNVPAGSTTGDQTGTAATMALPLITLIIAMFLVL